MWLNQGVIFWVPILLDSTWHCWSLLPWFPGSHTPGFPPNSRTVLWWFSQSSVLGPLLFYFYTHSLSDLTQCHDFRVAFRCMSLPRCLSLEIQTLISSCVLGISTSTKTSTSRLKNSHFTLLWSLFFYSTLHLLTNYITCLFIVHCLSSLFSTRQRSVSLVLIHIPKHLETAKYICEMNKKKWESSN